MILFSSVAPLPSGFGVKTLPCHANSVDEARDQPAQKVPEQTMA